MIELTWKFSDGIHTLHRGGAKGPVISVVADKIHPTMWRIKHRDGRLSDMVDLSRARDAAVAFAVGDYRQEAKGVGAAEGEGFIERTWRYPDSPQARKTPPARAIRPHRRQLSRSLNVPLVLLRSSQIFL